MLQKVLKVSLTLNIILLLVVVVTVLVLNADRHNAGKREHSSTKDDLIQNLNIKMFRDDDERACFSCHLGPDVLITDTLYDDIIDDIIDDRCESRRLCCVKKVGIVGTLIYQMFKTKAGPPFKEMFRTENWTLWTDRSDAIHTRLLGIMNAEAQWAADGAEASFQNGVELVNNRLRTRNPGLYFIYAAITHDFASHKVVDLNYHMVTKRHPLLAGNGDTVLLMDRNGGPDISAGLFTSFLCGAFSLRKGHEIGLKFSHTADLDRTPYSNLFGMFKIR